MTSDEFLKVDAVRVFHGHEILPTHLSEVVSLNDIRVNQASHEPRFTDEVRAEFVDFGVFLANQFDRDALYELVSSVLLRIINNADPAFCNDLNDLKMVFVEGGFDRLHWVA